MQNAGSVGVPKQLVIEKDPSSIPDAVKQAGLALPLGMFCRNNVDMMILI